MYQQVDVENLRNKRDELVAKKLIRQSITGAYAYVDAELKGQSQNILLASM